MHTDHAQRVREIERKLERGWITLEEILMLSAGSPIHLDEATELGRRAGLRMTEGGESDVWEDIEKLADEGQSAFTEPVREGPAAADDLAMGDPTSLYFREISRLHLLTADEEVMLAKQIEAGRSATEQLADLPLDDPNRPELEALARKGEAARKRMIESNLRLVVSVAKKYMGRGLSFLDLVQEGNIGLHRAVDKFDWRRGFRFSTYAYWWIRQEIGRAVAEQGRKIRLRFGLDRGGAQRTLGEVGQELGISRERVRQIEAEALRKLRRTEIRSRLAEYLEG